MLDDVVMLYLWLFYVSVMGSQIRNTKAQNTKTRRHEDTKITRVTDGGGGGAKCNPCNTFLQVGGSVAWG